MNKGKASGDFIGLMGFLIVAIKLTVLSLIVGLPLLLVIGGPILYFMMKSKEEKKNNE